MIALTFFITPLQLSQLLPRILTWASDLVYLRQYAYRLRRPSQPQAAHPVINQGADAQRNLGRGMGLAHRSRQAFLVQGDLAGNLGEAPGKSPGAQTQVLFELFKLSDTKRREFGAPTDAETKISFQPGIDGRADEIGRASCRERVCHCV